MKYHLFDLFGFSIRADTMMEALAETRVVTFKVDGSSLLLREACDYYYEVALTKAQALVLADEIRAMAETMT